MTPRAPAPPGPPEGGAPSAVAIPLADPDAVAWTLLAAGEARAAAAAVIRVHGARVRQYLRALLRDGDTADDAYSLWSEWTYRAIDRFQGASSLRTWAFGVAHNAARRVRDDAYRRRRCSLRRGGIALVPAARASSSARRVERAAAVLEAIRRKLSAGEQELLALRVDQGLDWQEVAAVLAEGGDSVSSTALRKRFERLKDRIQRIARELGELA